MAASAQNLSNKARNWTVVGIGLNVVLAPLLRAYVNIKLGNLYIELNRDYQSGGFNIRSE